MAKGDVGRIGELEMGLGRFVGEEAEEKIMIRASTGGASAACGAAWEIMNRSRPPDVNAPRAL